jgi:hypothetical protein
MDNYNELNMRVVYNKLSKEIVQVVEDDNSITAFPPDLAVIQGDEGEIVTIAQALSLDITQIPNLTMTNERVKILQRIKRCQDLKLRFLEENATVTISSEQSAAQLQAFMSVMMLLDVGDARTSLAIVSQIPASVFVLTQGYEDQQARKQSYIDELSNIVSELFEQ